MGRRCASNVVFGTRGAWPETRTFSNGRRVSDRKLSDMAGAHKSQLSIEFAIHAESAATAFLA